MSKFTDRLKLLKKISGKTQNEIAKELGITPQAMSYYMNGREPNFDTLIKLAQYFDVTTDYLIGLDDNPKPEPENFAHSDILTHSAVKTLAENPLLVLFINYLADTDYGQSLIDTLLDEIGMAMCSEDDSYILIAAENGKQIPTSLYMYASHNSLLQHNSPSTIDMDQYKYYKLLCENVLFNAIRDMVNDIGDSKDFYNRWHSYYQSDENICG